MVNLIIGSGFSSLCCQSLLPNGHSTIISPFGKHWGDYLDFNQRKNLSINKYLKLKSNSLGTINYILPNNVYLHDRFLAGGNSEIWGGFFDTSAFTSDEINNLSKHGIKFVQLSKKFGVSSNIKSIVQLQSSNNSIMNSSSFIKPDINGFVLEIGNLNDKKKTVKYIYKNESHFQIKEIEVDRIIISCGVIQTIDLLIRSNLIKAKDFLSLEENTYNLSFSLGEKIKSNKDECIISYKFNRAISHYFGISSKILTKVNIIPMLRVNQHFKNQKRKLILKVHDHGNIHFNNLISEQNLSIKKFGDSIHYCNLLINNTKINDIIGQYNNIIGVGMCFVSQNNPGPISNVIYSDCLAKI